MPKVTTPTITTHLPAITDNKSHKQPHPKHNKPYITYLLGVILMERNVATRWTPSLNPWACCGRVHKFGIP